MNNPSQEELLGYVFGALDAQEHRDVQQKIDQNPDLEDQLLRIKTALGPLDEIDTAGPPPGLARRTCETVANWQNRNSIDDPALAEDHLATPRSVAESSARVAKSDLAKSKSKVRFSPIKRMASPSTWAMTDLLVAVALVAVCAGILFPVISETRFNSRLVACQENLQQVGFALMDYSAANEGRFVQIPSHGNLAASGCFGPILKDNGFLENDSLLACAGVASSRPPVHIPSCDQIISATSKDQLNHYRQTMGGHYGYTMGYRENQKYVAPQNMGRSSVVLLADQPSLDLVGRRSANHAGRGQNCLFEDGHVQFVAGHTFGTDALFENDYGMVAPGSHALDNVIAPSHLSPVRLETIEYHVD